MSKQGSGPFAGKAVWITGGGSGIGLALGLAFAQQGAKVAVSGRRAHKLQDAVSQLDAAGGQGLAVVCDVTDSQSIDTALAEVVAAFGGLDVVVANAGFAISGRLEKVTFEEWRRQLDTNVIGLAMTAAAALPELRKTDGRIALIGSVAAFVPTPGTGAYGASKAAVRSIGETLSAELAGSGVSCTTIHPGFVESEIAQVDNRGVHHPDARDRRPAKLMWKADDAARVMLGAIKARKREFVFTGHGKLAAALSRATPGLVHMAVSRGEAKRNRRRRETT